MADERLRAGSRLAADRVPIRVQPVPQGGDQADAGYPGLASICRKLRH
jgi:hypothetical protein